MLPYAKIVSKEVIPMKNSINMTEGNILRNLIYFAIPVLIGNIFQQLYNVADAAISCDNG